MANSDLALNELSRVTAQLRADRTKVQQQPAGIDEQLRAVEITMRLCRHDKVRAEFDDYDAFVSELRRGKEQERKTQMDALMAIVAKYDGCFKVVDAQRLMLEAGLIKIPKNAPSIIYTLISRSGRFEKVKAGEYRLLPETSWESKVGEWA